MTAGEQTYPIESEDGNPVAVDRDGTLAAQDKAAQNIQVEILETLQEILAILKTTVE